jgi:hypothetical protein
MASELGVQTIQHTNGTDAMTIDSSGRVLTPARPAFRVYKTGSTGSATQGQLSFNNEDYDIGGGFSTNYYQAPVAGVYHFSLSALGCNSAGNAISANQEVSIDFETSTNSGSSWTARTRMYTNVGAAGYPNLSGSADLKLNATDRVRVKVNSNYVYFNASENNLVFSGHLVG